LSGTKKEVIIEAVLVCLLQRRHCEKAKEKQITEKNERTEQGFFWQEFF